MPERLPPAYLRALFDQYAPHYEQSLLGNLAYRAPALLRAAVDAACPSAGGSEAVLDLGCGTGLAGAVFRDRAGWLEGVDLSPQMLAAAARKKLYDRLSVHEIAAFLAAPPRRYDLILAADVLVYMGALPPVFAAAAATLAPGGLFALTLQKSAGGSYALGPDQRYAHAPAYVGESAAAAGLTVLRLEEASYRTERAQPVPGLLAVLRRDV
jgi:predicted TPR repeat methyltransferase